MSLSLRTSAIEVDVDIDRGAQIVRVARPDGPNALAFYDWDAPVPASRSHSYGDDELDWLSGYRGGWQETFPNAGQACVVDGVPVAFHGEASTAPWRVEAQDEESCTLSVAARLPLTLTRTMTVDASEPVLHLESVVTNVGAVPIDFVWGHHPVFPALAGARIEYPAGATVRPDADRTAGTELAPVAWPHARRLDGTPLDLSVVPDEPRHLLAYVDNLAEGWAAVRQPAGAPGVAIAWDNSVHPYSWLWLMTDDPGFPWYGRASLLSIECQTAWPYDGLAAARNRGQAHRLAAREQLRSWYTMRLLDDDERPITGVARDGSVTWGSAPVDAGR